MDTNIFLEVLRRRLDLTTQVLNKKAAEYAKGDRLSNFKRAGRMLNKRPEEVCVGLLIKQFVCVIELVEEMIDGNELPKLEYVDEKIGDTINYLILLEAIIHERCGFHLDSEMSQRAGEILWIGKDKK